MEINGNNTNIGGTKIQGKEAYKVEQIPASQVPPQPGAVHFVTGPDGMPLTQEQINQLPPEVKAALGQVPNLGNGQIPPIPDVVGAETAKAQEAAKPDAADTVTSSIFGKVGDVMKEAFGTLSWKEKMVAGKAIHESFGFRKWYELHRVNPLDQSDIAPIIVGIIAGAGLTLVAGWIFSSKGE